MRIGAGLDPQDSRDALGRSMSGPRITRAEAWLCDLAVEQPRSDAMQSFVKQETVIVRIWTDAGVEGVGYSYTIGTGGGAVISLLENGLLRLLPGMEIDRVEQIWRMLLMSTKATTIGVITALALAAVDTAVWDARLKCNGLPLSIGAGGASSEVPVYDTEGGWLHYATDELVERAVESRRSGMGGVKIKVGKPRASEDLERLSEVRKAVGDDFDIMVDANQAFTLAEARRRAALYEQVGVYWFEEPLPAEDVDGHAQLARSTSIPIAVGESVYSIGHFKEFLRCGGASIVQVDVARIGGITPWLKVAHLAEAFNVDVAPHFLMELHVSLVCAIPNSLYLEYIPQLGSVTHSRLAVGGGVAEAPTRPGLGIEWDWDALDSTRVRD